MKIAAKIKKIASILAIPIVVIIVMLYHYYKMKRADDNYSKEYVLIKREEFIDDIVSSIYLPKGFKANPYSLYIKIGKTGKRTLRADLDKNQRSINDVIRIGTLISKQKDNDTVVLTNITASDTSVYHFRILDSDYK